MQLPPESPVLCRGQGCLQPRKAVVGGGVAAAAQGGAVRDGAGAVADFPTQENPTQAVLGGTEASSGLQCVVDVWQPLPWGVRHLVEPKRALGCSSCQVCDGCHLLSPTLALWRAALDAADTYFGLQCCLVP